jgi:hypothetical protein
MNIKCDLLVYNTPRLVILFIGNSLIYGQLSLLFSVLKNTISLDHYQNYDILSHLFLLPFVHTNLT